MMTNTTKENSYSDVFLTQQQKKQYSKYPPDAPAWHGKKPIRCVVCDEESRYRNPLIRVYSIPFDQGISQYGLTPEYLSQSGNVSWAHSRGCAPQLRLSDSEIREVIQAEKELHPEPVKKKRSQPIQKPVESSPTIDHVSQSDSLYASVNDDTDPYMTLVDTHTQPQNASLSPLGQCTYYGCERQAVASSILAQCAEHDALYRQLAHSYGFPDYRMPQAPDSASHIFQDVI